jgi:general secretion pathway protein D
MTRMRVSESSRALLVSLVVASLTQAQYMPPPQQQQQQPPPGLPQQQQPQQARPPANQPPANTPAKPAGQAPAGQTPAGQQAPPPATAPQSAPPTPALTDSGGFLLDNVSLVELVDILARRLKINYILDPRVGGKVTIHTYGEVKPTDLMPLLETILRINNAAMVKVGDLYRIVPISAVPNLPLKPQVNVKEKELSDDERVIMNMIFLKYVTVADLYKLIEPFLGEGAKATTYEPANLLILLDNSRSMRRTMDLIALFDSDTFASQRVRAFQTKNGRPSELSKELEGVFRAFSFSDKSTGTVKFIPVDRINTILAVASNPGTFGEVEKWLAKLDIAVKAPTGAVDNYAYRLKYGRAEVVAFAIMALYSGNPFAMMGLAQMSNQAGAAGGMGAGGMGYGGMGYGGMGYGGMGYGGMGYGGIGYGGMGGYGMGYGGMGAGGMGFGMPGMGYGMGNMYGNYAPPPSGTSTQALAQAGAAPAPGVGTDQTGQYLGQYGYGMGPAQRVPHIIPNPLNNTLLIQATPTEWEQISRLLAQLDVPPRQVLIEAKIYSVDLSGALAGGVDAFLQRVKGGESAVPTAPAGTSRTPLASSNFNSGSGFAQLTTGLLVGHSRELLAIVQAAETHSKAKVIQAPSIIATDSISASLNVGEDVPTLTSQGIAAGAQSSGNSLFTNTVGSRSTGVSLNITPFVNASGVVTMMINQNVSAPQPTTTSNISSPSFATKTVQTQVTVQDGDTIALAGIISESEATNSVGIPFLSRIPVVGAAFGTKSLSKARTELIVFITPRVIYDSNQLVEATEELKNHVKGLQKLFK